MDLLQEVDEMMKRERMERLWKENSAWIIGTIVAIILGTMLLSGYKGWQKSVAEDQTATLISIIEQSDFPANVLEESKDFQGGARSVALLIGAGTYQDKGDVEAALDLYSKAAKIEADPALQGLAMMMQSKLDAQLSDDEKTQMYLRIIEKDSPWQYHAQLELSMMAAGKEDYTKANAHIAKVLSAQAVPQSLIQKARAMKHVYALKAQNTISKKNSEG